MKRLPHALLGAMLALSLSSQAQPQPQAQGHPVTPSTAVAGGIVLPDFADLVEKYGPAVVSISTQTRVTQRIPGISEDDPFYDFFRRFMPPEQRNAPKGRGQPQPEPKGPLRPYGLGSGFIVTQDGYIVTNAHVVENAEEITVRLNDKREFKAKVVGADTRSDVAVLKVDATALPTVKIGDVSKLRVGEWVIAIGSPFNFTNSVTAGIVSAKFRDNLAGDPNLDAVPFIQTDVAVNPGNSGGPLLNMRGEVVGINSQIFSRTGSFAGISFAIPIDYAYNVADQIMKTGHVTRGRIGVGIQNVTRDIADSLGLPKAEGAVVGNVDPDSPASRAGVEVGDVIQKIDGRTVEGSADLSRTIRAIRPGQKVTLTVWRNGKARELPVTIAEFKDPDEQKVADAGKGSAKAKEPLKTDKLGLAVKELSAEDKKALKIAAGVMVEASDGAAAAAQVGPGDVILRINNTEITSVKTFKDTVAKLDLKKPVSLLIRDQDGQRFITFRPEVG
ncbi:MAG TPA: DegQ family serine endoprotease [Usitatibacter sp.]|nr:DegQ family serine endoprotease [Usitatibacter sp.]